MGMMKRIGSIFKAKANTAVEKAERNDPVGIAKAELQEAKEDLAKFEQAVKQASGQKILLERQIKEKEASAKDWKEKAKIAKEGENFDLAMKAAERSIGFADEATSLKSTLDATASRYTTQRQRFENKRKDIDALGRKIKDADIRFKTAKAMNDLDTSETSGAGVKSVDRINDMLNIVDEESAMADASVDINTTDDQRLDDEFAKMGSDKKANDLLDSL